MKLTDFPTFRRNPFLNNLFIKESSKITKLKDTDLTITDNFGKVVDKVVLAKEHNIDRTPFVKMFEFDFLFDLDKSGAVVFAFICKRCIRYGNDQVVIFVEDVLSSTKYNSTAPIYRGIAALIKAKVIARTHSPNIFWLNPAIVYKGERWYLNK